MIKRILLMIMVPTVILCFASVLIADSETPRQTVRIAAFNFYPAIFQAKDGSVQGFYVDFLKEIAKREGWNIEYVYGSWADGLTRIKTGEVDVLTNVAFTNERAAFMDYAKTPLLTVWAELYVPKNSDLANIRQVKGKKIAIMKGDFNGATFRDRIEKFEIACDFIEYGNFEEVFKAVAAGQADAGVVNNTFGSAKQQEFGLRSSDVIMNPFDIFFTVAKGKNQQLLQTLDKYLTEWRQDESSPYHQARKHWAHGTASTIHVIPSWLHQLFLALIVLAAIAIIFIWTLRAQVKKKTAELKFEIAGHIKTTDDLHLTTRHLEDELAERQTAQAALLKQTSLLEEQIAERKRTEEALLKSELNFKTIFDASNEAILIQEPATGAVLGVNNTMSEMYGYDALEALQLTVEDLSSGIPPYTQTEALSWLQKATAGQPQMFEWQAKDKSGRLFWVDVRMRLTSIEDEPMVIVAIRDISERKINEMWTTGLLKISQFEFTTELDFLDYALNEVIRLTESRFGYIYLYDEQKKLFTLNSWSNGVMAECSVMNPETVYELDKTGIWGEAVRQRSAILINDFQTDNPLRKGLPDGHVPLLKFLTVPVFFDGTIVAVVGVANSRGDYHELDISQLTIYMNSVWKLVAHKRSEMEHMKLEQQLLHAQKLESLGVLAGGIAHDFNNILTAIIGNADLALMRISKESPGMENLRKIEIAAAQAADLAKQMLAYSGKGKFLIEHIDLNRLLEEMLHMLEVSISKKAILRLNLFPNLPALEVDASQIRQIVMNLVINASEAIGDKSGVIAISTGCMDCDKNYLKDVWLIENIGEGLYVYLEISDTGCGMDKETIAKIFDPFFTTKFTGRGLGMAAVMGIVRGHKGAIKVYSELGKGTTFKILLPASGKPIEIFNHESHPDNWQGSGKVLLVDDEESVRGIGREMLQELGFDVITANDGRDALEVFKNDSDIQLVILDLTMPHVDGEQCYRELRQLRPDIKVIMSSGYNEQEVTQKFVGKGLAGFVQKPYKLSVLKEAIQKV